MDSWCKLHVLSSFQPPAGGALNRKWFKENWVGEKIDIEGSQFKWLRHLQRMPPGCVHLELSLTQLTGGRPWGRPSFSSFTIPFSIPSYHYLPQNPTGFISDVHCLTITSFSLPPRLSIFLFHALLNSICWSLCTYLSRLSVLYRNLLYSSRREACVCRIMML